MKSVWVTFAGVDGYFNLHQISHIQPAVTDSYSGTSLFMANGTRLYVASDPATVQGVIDAGVTAANAA